MTIVDRDVDQPGSEALPSGFVPQRGELALPLPPKFEAVADEREHRKQRLAGALRLFGRFGFGEGVAGHITARDPELTDHFWVNPFGMSFRHVKVSDLILVNHEGEVVHGNRPVNRAAFIIHAAVHQARPDAVTTGQRIALDQLVFGERGQQAVTGRRGQRGGVGDLDESAAIRPPRHLLEDRDGAAD